MEEKKKSLTTFDTLYANGVVDQLRSNTRLDDTAVMQVLYLLRDLHGSKEREIHVLNSHYVALAYQQGRAKKAIQSILAQNNETVLIIVPVFNDAHWSFLFFVPRLLVYMHLDSYSPYHARYVKNLVARLDPDKRYASMAPPIQPSQQYSIWECGLFLLMNAYMLISAVPDQLVDRETLLLHLTRHMNTIREENRVRFTRKIIKLILNTLH